MRPIRTERAAGRFTVEAFFAHFVPSAPPADLERALTTKEHPYAQALYRWRPAEEERDRERFGWSGENGQDGDDEDDDAEQLADREWGDARLLELLRDDTRRQCDRLFADPVLGHYLWAVGNGMRVAI